MSDLQKYIDKKKAKIQNFTKVLTMVMRSLKSAKLLNKPVKS